MVIRNPSRRGLGSNAPFIASGEPRRRRRRWAGCLVLGWARAAGWVLGLMLFAPNGLQACPQVHSGRSDGTRHGWECDEVKPKWIGM